MEYKVEILFFTTLFAIVFFQIQQANVQTLLSILLITLWGMILWYYLQQRELPREQPVATAILDKENDTRLEVPEIASTNYYVKTAPKKGLKYLKNNDTLLKIAKNLIFVKTFDAQKYQEMLVYMNSYQKVYMYILAERYLCKSYVPTFLDLRQNILEIMYQYYIVVPKDFKHIYGVSPYKEIDKSIKDFIKLSRTMIEILENFCRLELKEHYFPPTLPMPNNEENNPIKAHILP